jgi:hypothetical protein
MVATPGEVLRFYAVFAFAGAAAGAAVWLALGRRQPGQPRLAAALTAALLAVLGLTSLLAVVGAFGN